MSPCTSRPWTVPRIGPALVSALLLIPFGSQAATVAWFYALDQDRQAFEKATSAPLRTQKIGGTVLADYRVGNTRVVAAKMGSGLCGPCPGRAGCSP